MSINEAVGDQVRHLIQEGEMTQQQLAEKAGLSIDHVGKIERGTTSPTVEALAKVADALGVDIKTLFDLDEKITSEKEASTALVEFNRYLRQKRAEDVEFALSIIRQILDR